MERGLFHIVLGFLALSAIGGTLYFTFKDGEMPIETCVDYQVPIVRWQLLLGNRDTVECNEQTTDELLELKITAASNVARKFCEEMTGYHAYEADEGRNTLVCTKWDKYGVTREFRIIWSGTSPMVVATDGVLRQGGKTQ